MTRARGVGFSALVVTIDRTLRGLRYRDAVLTTFAGGSPDLAELNAMLDAVVRWIQPFRRFGVDPERVALTLGLAIQALPGTIAIALETRDAARARGLERRPRAYLSPFVVRVVARAQETGDALAARGLGDD